MRVFRWRGNPVPQEPAWDEGENRSRLAALRDRQNSGRLAYNRRMADAHSRKLAFVGLGIMGAPMAGHLLAAGHRLVVHTRTKAKAKVLLDGGAGWAESAKQAAAEAEVVFVCVTDTPD